MSEDTFSLIFEKLRTEKIKNLHPALYHDNLTMDLDEIFSVCKNEEIDQDVRNMARALLITKCDLDEFDYDKGFKYIDEGIKLINDLPEEKECIFQCLDSVIVKIELTEDSARFIEVAGKISKYFKDRKDAICHARANTKIASILWQKAVSIADSYNPEFIKETLELMKIFRDLGFEFKISSGVIINEILTHFEGKLADESNFPNSAIEFYRLERLLESFELEDEIKSRFDQLCNQMKERIPKEEKKRLNDQLKNVKIIQINHEELIYDKTKVPSFARKTPHFQVAIYHGMYDNKKVAIKMYQKLSDNESNPNFEKVYTEIKVYQYLSDLSNHQNCFLKYYGTVFTDNAIYLVMDYIKDDLMNRITNIRETKSELDQRILVTSIRKLIASFAEMESVHIYHGDIKPHNILIDEFFNMKIIDFSISAVKNEDVTSSETNSEHLLQGTVGYMAPEIQDKKNIGAKKGRFKKGLADVFSLGIVILQLITLEKVENLNTTGANPELLNRINNVKFEWARKLLSSMLNANPKKRSSFKDLLVFIADEETLGVTQ